jgi:hypothetical protein
MIEHQIDSLTDITILMHQVLEFKKTDTENKGSEDENRLLELLYDLSEEQREILFSDINQVQTMIPVYPRLYCYLPIAMQHNQKLVEENIFQHTFLYAYIPDEFKTPAITEYCINRDFLLFLDAPEHEQDNILLLKRVLEKVNQEVDNYHQLISSSDNQDKKWEYSLCIEGLSSEEAYFFDHLNMHLKEKLGWLNLSYHQAKPLLDGVNYYLDKEKLVQKIESQLSDDTNDKNITVTPKI